MNVVGMMSVPKKNNLWRFLMNTNEIIDTLCNMSPALRKELLNKLVTFVLSDLSEAEKKELLQTVLAGQKKDRQVIEMVEH